MTATVDQLPARIASRIRVEQATDRPVRGLCWIWTGCLRGPDGYGAIWYKNRTRPIHCVTYELLVGSIPDELEHDHVCHVRICCNPDHLDPVTHRVNIRRGVAIGRPRRTECDHGHALVGDNIRIYTNPSGAETRLCQACHERRVRDDCARRRATRAARQAVAA